MKLLSLLWDILEITAVFLLAVEAIKLQNLQWIRFRTISLHGRINPQITFVDELPKDTKFVDRYCAELDLIGFFTFGAVTSLLSFRMLDIPFMSLVPHTVPGWLLFVIGVLLGPVLIGLLAYSCVVSLLQWTIATLSWIEANTRNGAVGILGFIFFLVQFIGRRL